MAFTIDPAEAVYDFRSSTVVFYLEDGGARVRCGVCQLALVDDYGATSTNQVEMLEVFRENCVAIGKAAERKHRGGLTEPNGHILVRTGDR
ncbi:MAG TPA: DUF1488 family protein [Acetobacteraceae bacterium]|nr:DUF1488 family protein [Acetobacteraceae bacterium]